MRNEQTMEALREEEQLCFCPWVNRQQGGREISVRGCSATRGEKKKKYAWVKSVFFLSIQKSTMGGVCVEAWTDSPATSLPKQLTAITSLSCLQKLLNGGSWNKTKENDTWVFPPFWLKV